MGPHPCWPHCSFSTLHLHLHPRRPDSFFPMVGLPSTAENREDGPRRGGGLLGGNLSRSRGTQPILTRNHAYFRSFNTSSDHISESPPSNPNQPGQPTAYLIVRRCQREAISVVADGDQAEVIEAEAVPGGVGPREISNNSRRDPRRRVSSICQSTWTSKSPSSSAVVEKVGKSVITSHGLDPEADHVEVTGTLKGYDPLMNLVLDDVKETLRGDLPFPHPNRIQ